MPLRIFDTSDAVPEPLRATAIETKDGKFAVVEEEDVSGLRSALEKERNEKRAATKLAKEREAEFAALRTETEAKAAGLTGEKLAEIRAQAEAKFKGDIEERDRLKAENRALKLNDRVKALMAKADFIDVDAAFSLHAADFDLTDDGTPIVKADPTKALDQHIADIATQRPYLVKGSQASGGGAGHAKSGKPSGSEDVFAWTEDQRAAFIRANGPDAYMQKLNASTVARATATPKAA
jgi:hypothetical protein